MNMPLIKTPFHHSPFDYALLQLCMGEKRCACLYLISHEIGKSFKQNIHKFVVIYCINIYCVSNDSNQLTYFSLVCVANFGRLPLPLNVIESVTT